MWMMYDDRSGDPLLQRKGETVSRTCATDIGYTEPRLPHLHRPQAHSAPRWVRSGRRVG